MPQIEWASMHSTIASYIELYKIDESSFILTNDYSILIMDTILELPYEGIMKNSKVGGVKK